MKKKLFLLFIVLILTLCSCSGQEKHVVAPNGVPDDFIAVLPSGDELYIYMDRYIVEQLIHDESIQDDRKLFIYDDIDLIVGYINDKLVYLSFGSGSEIYLKSGISTDTNVDDIKDNDFETYKDQYAVKRYIHDEGEFTMISENVGSEAEPFEYTNISLNFQGGTVTNISVFDVYAGLTSKFDE